ncbi:spermidine/putrescine ABC transporter [Klebsiella pneumoniae]|uniref:Spermidine/putrescine ABC transporter n=1 Tax=Klebsiella pneumoniae TaxID=573 RepID=A0A377W3W7_KLEPN|nr:spermidine/putrescine ABC transporter [Klebsiella pneumoniae]
MGLIGSDQTAVMARLALDELIDQLLHSNALSLKLTANPLVADRAWHLTENTCIRAFSADDPQAKKRAHHALFILYQSWLADPLSPAAANQFSSAAFRGSEITSSLSGCGRKANASTTRDQCLTPAISSTKLRALCQQHPASHHPLFDFLASEASAAQIDYFFKSDSALNLLFFDLVAMGLVGSLPETRAEIAQNLWDEIGQGSTEITHVNLYKDLLKRRNIALPDNHFAHLYEWQGLAGYNAFMLGGRKTVSITTNHWA